MLTTNNKLVILLAISLLALSACSHAPKRNHNSNSPTITRTEQEKNLNSLTNWHIIGKIALATPSKSGSMGIDWQQAGNSYTVHVRGPLGQNSFYIIGDDSQVKLNTSDGKHYSASNPQALLLKHAGWSIPITNLIYWARSLPVPSQPGKFVLDSHNRMRRLHQGGWQLEYDRYQRVAGYTLPGYLKLTSGDISIKLIIKEWKLQTQQPAI